MGTTRRPGGVWRERNFAVFWLGETTSQVGSAVTVVALPLVAVEVLHASALLVSLLAAAVWLPWLVLGLPAGAWVDRLPARRVMLVCDVVSLLAFASVPIAQRLGVLSVAQLLVVALAAGSALVFFRPAYQVLLPDIVAVDDLAEGNAKLTGSQSAAQIGGPGLGGALAQAVGPSAGLLVDAASFAISFVCLLLVRTTPRAQRADAVGRTAPAVTEVSVATSAATAEAPQPQSQSTDRPHASIRREAAEGLRFAWHDPYLRVQAVFAAAANMTLTGMDAVLVVFLVRTVGLSDAAVGWVLAAFGVGGLLGALIAGRMSRRFGTGRTMALAAACCLPVGLLLPLTTAGTGILFAVAATAVLGGGIVVSNVIGDSFLQVYVPPHLLGRVTAATLTLAFATMPVGSVIAGVLATVIGLRPTMWVLTAAIAATGLLYLVSPVSRVRDLPQRPELGAGLPQPPDPEAEIPQRPELGAELPQPGAHRPIPLPTAEQPAADAPAEVPAEA